ncbi:MAG: helix-turn-helix domain-containing protein [Robiginitalea sp.]
MIFDSFSHFRDHPAYNKFVDADYLIVEYKCPIEEENFKSWSECHYITYVLSGKKKWLTPDRDWTLTSGQSVFVHKGAYLNQQFFEEDFCVLMFFMTDRFIKNFVRSDLQPTISPEETGLPASGLIEWIEVTETLSTLYNSFFGYLKQETAPPKKLIELKFREMLLNVVTNPANAGTFSAILDIARNDGISMEQVMEDNFFYHLSLEEYARLCGRSLSTFKRDFKKVFKSTPGRWLTLRRLQYARQLLMGSDLNVTEVCYDSGFENPSHFVRAFKNAFGITPLEFKSKKIATAF